MNSAFPYDLVLASASPRRKELLEQMGFDFKVEVVDADETPDGQLAVEQLPAWLAKKKAGLIPFIAENTLVIAADTLVILDNRILGKPRNPMEAEEMLKSLSGTSHQVITGV
ncbi:MAG: septum formation inhibitor Maf, partial [Bacteroidetes bacterium]|nr:septum formation inhibitor Maf [Bacteroidota bacterium]